MSSKEIANSGEKERSPFNYVRRKSREVRIGNLMMGGNQPIRLQSMANRDTNDTGQCVEQAMRIIDAGGELVRFTAQGVKEASNLGKIHEALQQAGYGAPLVADIHFNPEAAETAARLVEKVRINPGNFVSSIQTKEQHTYTDKEYTQEIEKIRKKLFPLLQICEQHQTAIRIGVNHGSLSSRIVSRYGDTPRGMVESCMEFLRLCDEYDFQNIVVSIKSSNTVSMVQTVRLLSKQMETEGLPYPLHLGVTEAGDGEDGRIKSAVGIGALLMDGIGDTIRVSLSEEPEYEISVAKKLVEYITAREGHPSIITVENPDLSRLNHRRRETNNILQIGSQHPPVVIASSCETCNDLKADFTYIGKNIKSVQKERPTIVDYEVWEEQENLYPLFTPENSSEIRFAKATAKFLELSQEDYTPALKDKIDESTVFILNTTHLNGVGEQRAFIHTITTDGLRNPVILKRRYEEDDEQNMQIMSGADLGIFFIDGLGDGLWIENEKIAPQKMLSISFGILQASRARISKTEFISCPGCGRTLFDLQTTIKRVKEKTSHLKELKIGIMGCIVNGPGEMADADYGYVGSGRGKVNLYKGQTCVEKLIPEEDAVEKLILLIKENGDWKEENPAINSD